MPFLLDTNVLSELRKGERCDAAVAAWADHVRHESHYLSALSLGEIRKGIELLRRKAPRDAAALEVWLARLIDQYEGAILGITPEIAETWGRLCARRPLPVVDSLLAATALEFGLTVATRNTTDFKGTGVKTINPFRFAS
jgi:predicted nucleic acid-binding protein